MTENAPLSCEQLERELQFYRTEYNALGARMVRMQEQHGQITRDSRRRKIVARLVREAYAIGSWDVAEEAIGEPILSIVADNSICDQAIFFVKDPNSANIFTIEHSVGCRADQSITIVDPPDFLFTSSAEKPGSVAQSLIELVGVPFLLWANNPRSGRALLLGKRTEGNIHRPFEGGDREIVEVALAVYEDVLLRKRAEAALRHAKLVAEEANNARARFLANFSHELRTPLNAIIGFAQLLIQQGNQTRPPEETEEYARLILDAGESISTLAKDILDFSYLSNGKPKLRIDWVQIQYLFHSAARSVSSQSAQFGIRIKISQCCEDLQAAIDYDRFRQILANLLTNALKFTPAGGSVDLAAELTDNKRLMLTIRDDGIGIMEKDIPRVFEPFVQLNGPVNGLVRGAGLGLPIALQLVDAHGGEMRVESVFGEGTAVIITLPPDSARLFPQTLHCNAAIPAQDS